jgi:uncharacterized protein (TIGR00730 family)
MHKIETLTVYLGSSGRARPIFREAAEKLGTLIGEQKKKLVYGGMDAGLMGIIANKAIEAGAHVTGIVPKKLKDSERIHPTLSETVLVGDLWERKRKMFLAADAVIGLPGGFGTLDESLEVLYWGHLGLHDKPLVLVNIDDYWDPIIHYLKNLPDFSKRFLITVNRIEDLFPALAKWNFGHAIIEKGDKLPHFEDDILSSGKAPILIREATVKDTYHLITALGLKQLGRHNRPIGVLNDKGQFDKLLTWLQNAQKEHFITDKCLALMDVDRDETALRRKLQEQQQIEINLHVDKWGPGEAGSHLEVHEEK